MFHDLRFSYSPGGGEVNGLGTPPDTPLQISSHDECCWCSFPREAAAQQHLIAMEKSTGSEFTIHSPESVTSIQYTMVDEYEFQSNCISIVYPEFVLHISRVVPVPRKFSMFHDLASQRIILETGTKYLLEVYPHSHSSTISYLFSMHSSTSNSSEPKRRKPNVKLLSEEDADRISLHELVPTSEVYCRVCNGDTSEPVRSYEFQCTLYDGNKNLRQKPHYIDIFNNETKVGYIKFKVHADSTIRRGRKSLRRSCVVFELKDLLLHFKTGSNSLKWTEEKVDKFLAFESKCSYSFSMYSTNNWNPSSSVCFVGHGPPVVIAWKDVGSLSVSNSTDIGSSIDTDEVTIAPSSSGDGNWLIQPSMWSLGVERSDEEFIAMVGSANGSKVFPKGAPPPMVVFVERDGTRVVAHAKQYNARSRRSFVFVVPKLVSQERIYEAARKGLKLTKHVDMIVMDGYFRKLWQTTFTYEVGLPNAADYVRPSQEIRLYVRVDATGWIGGFDVDPSQTSVFDLKRRVELEVINFVRLSATNQYLHQSNDSRMEMEDQMLLSQCKVTAGDTIHLKEKIGDYVLETRIDSLCLSKALVYSCFSVLTGDRVLLWKVHDMKSQRRNTHSFEQCNSGSILQSIALVDNKAIVFDTSQEWKNLPTVMETAYLTISDRKHLLSMSMELMATLTSLHALNLCFTQLGNHLVFVRVRHDENDDHDTIEQLRLGSFGCIEQLCSSAQAKADIVRAGHILYRLCTLDVKQRCTSSMVERVQRSRHSLHSFVDLITDMLEGKYSASRRVLEWLEKHVPAASGEWY